MRLKRSYNIEGTEYNLGPFYKSDVRQLVNIGNHHRWVFEDTLGDPRVYFRERMKQEDSFFCTLRLRSKVLGYGSVDPFACGHGLTHYWKLPDSGAKFDDIVCTGRLLQLYAFLELGLERLTQYVLPEKTTAIAMIEQGNYVYEGRLRDALSYAGKRKDVLVYGLLKREVL